MDILNIEVKVKCENPVIIEEVLKANNARFTGEDFQTDTYYKVLHGRLKLREGNIEKKLIFYAREETKGLKKSEVILYNPSKDIVGLKKILSTVLEEWVVVKKKRKIFFIGNVKFHIDTLSTLGTFVEIEAMDKTGKKSIHYLQTQCEKYIKLLGLQDAEHIDKSYSDLVLEQ